MLKPIVKVIEVPVDASAAYQLFTQHMGDWWPLDTRSISFHTVGHPATSLVTEPVKGGAIIEIGPDDARHVWGIFSDCDPSNSVTIDFHMGHPRENATHLVVTFIDLGESHTLVKLVHSGWECYGSLAPIMHDGYDRGWDEIFVQAFASACETARQRPLAS